MAQAIFRHEQRTDSKDDAYASMIQIPGGTFRMGSDLHYPEEAPVHRALTVLTPPAVMLWRTVFNVPLLPDHEVPPSVDL